MSSANTGLPSIGASHFWSSYFAQLRGMLIANIRNSSLVTIHASRQISAPIGYKLSAMIRSSSLGASHV